MKSSVLRIAFLLIVCGLAQESKAQVTRTLIKKDTMSCFIGDWEKNIDLRYAINNSTGSMKRFQINSWLYKATDSLVIQHEGKTTLTLLPNTKDTIKMDTLFRFEDCLFNDALCGYLYDYGRLREGTYKFKVVLTDSASAFPYTTYKDSTTFFVDGNQAPGLRYPINNAEVDSSILNQIIFKWYPVYPNPPALVEYNLVIKRQFSTQTVDQAWSSNPSIIDMKFNNMYFYALTPTQKLLFNAGYKYIWRVTAKNVANNHWVGNNYGRSELYELFINRDTSSREQLSYQVGNKCLPVNFDEGKFLGWEKDTFDNWDFPQFPNVVRVTNDNQFKLIQTSIRDPYGDFFIPKTVISAKLNDSVPAHTARSLLFLYTADSNHLSYNMDYAMVGYDSHYPADSTNGYFAYKLSRGRVYSDWDYIDGGIKQPSRKDSTFYTYYPNPVIRYKPWNCIVYDLTKRRGQPIRVELTASDCNANGHFGYAYADFCGVSQAIPVLKGKTNFCISDLIYLMGDSSVNLDSYVLQIQYCDSTGKADSTRIYQKSGITNVLDTLAIDSTFIKQGLTIGCEQYYKVTLTVMNECTAPFSTSKIIKIDCPGMGLAGTDKCCDDGTIILGDTAKSNYTYSWSPNEFLDAYNRSTATFTPTGTVIYPKSYYLTATDTLSGCSSTDTVTIFCSPPNCPIRQVFDSCSAASTFSTSCNHNFSYLNWVIQVNHKNGTKSFHNYTADSIRFTPTEDTSIVYLTAVNPCGQYKDTAYIYGGKLPYDTLMCATAVSISSPIDKNRKLIFYDPYSDTISGHAYYDYYALRVQFMGQNGQIFNGPIFYNPGGTGFINGTLYWEPKFANGDYLPVGKYQINVQYKKCSDLEEWSNFFRITQLEYSCQIKGKMFWRKMLRYLFGFPICKNQTLTWVPYSAWDARVYVYK